MANYAAALGKMAAEKSVETVKGFVRGVKGAAMAEMPAFAAASGFASSIRKYANQKESQTQNQSEVVKEQRANNVISLEMVRQLRSMNAAITVQTRLAANADKRATAAAQFAEEVEREKALRDKELVDAIKKINAGNGIVEKGERGSGFSFDGLKDILKDAFKKFLYGYMGKQVLDKIPLPGSMGGSGGGRQPPPAGGGQQPPRTPPGGGPLPESTGGSGGGRQPPRTPPGGGVAGAFANIGRYVLQALRAVMAAITSPAGLAIIAGSAIAYGIAKILGKLGGGGPETGPEKGGPYDYGSEGNDPNQPTRPAPNAAGGAGSGSNSTSQSSSSQGGTPGTRATSSELKWTVPITGKFVVTSPFGVQRNTGTHKGVDLAPAVKGTASMALAAANGTITEVRSSGSYGNYVQISHGDGVTSVYAHLNDFTRGVYKGRRVTAGFPLGTVGNTGRSRGIHLHFEIAVKGNQQDPANYIPSLRAGKENEPAITGASGDVPAPGAKAGGGGPSVGVAPNTTGGITSAVITPSVSAAAQAAQGDPNLERKQEQLLKDRDLIRAAENKMSYGTEIKAKESTVPKDIEGIRKNTGTTNTVLNQIKKDQKFSALKLDGIDKNLKPIPGSGMGTGMGSQARVQIDPVQRYYEDKMRSLSQQFEQTTNRLINTTLTKALFPDGKITGVSREQASRPGYIGDMVLRNVNLQKKMTPAMNRVFGKQFGGQYASMFSQAGGLLADKAINALGSSLPFQNDAFSYQQIAGNLLTKGKEGKAARKTGREQLIYAMTGIPTGAQSGLAAMQSFFPSLFGDQTGPMTPQKQIGAITDTLMSTFGLKAGSNMMSIKGLLGGMMNMIPGRKVPQSRDGSIPVKVTNLTGSGSWSEKLDETLGGGFRDFSKKAEETVGGFSGIAKTGLEGMFNGIKTFGSAVGSTMQNLFGGVGKTMSGLFDGMETKNDGFIGSLVKSTGNFMSGLGSLFSTGLSALLKGLISILSGLGGGRGGGGGFFDNIMNMFTGGNTGSGGIFETVVNMFRGNSPGAGGSVAGSILSTGLNAITGGGFGAHAGALAGGLDFPVPGMDMAGALAPGGFGGVVSSLGSYLTSSGMTTLGSLASSLGGGISAVSGAISGAMSGVGSALASAFPGIASAVGPLAAIPGIGPILAIAASFAKPHTVVGKIVGGIGKDVSKVTSGVKKVFKKIFSDERLKKNIKPITELPNGLTLYEYEWKDSIQSVLGDAKQTGFIAQEVQKVFPDVVSQSKSGFKMIDIEKLHNNMVSTTPTLDITPNASSTSSVYGQVQSQANALRGTTVSSSMMSSQSGAQPNATVVTNSGNDNSSQTTVVNQVVDNDFVRYGAFRTSEMGRLSFG